MKPLHYLFLLVFSVFLAAFSLALFPFPYIWIFLIFAIILISIAITAKHRIWKLITFNLALISFAFLIFESILWFVVNEAKKPVKYSKEYYTSNVLHLGYAPQSGIIFPYHYLGDGTTIYDVTYSINDAGLRVTPPARFSEAPAVLFFGGSFTFGEGVNDDETMPARVADRSAYAYNVFNFGFHGYGPHQMLSALENSLVEKVLQGAVPEVFIYQTLSGHAARSAGIREWDMHGPMYILNKEGGAEYSGTFDKFYFQKLLKQQVKKSGIGQKFIPLSRKTSKADVDLMVAIVAKSQKIVKTKWPQAEFHIIFWDEGSEISTRLIDGFREKGMNCHFIGEAASDIYRNRSEYMIPMDGHPNAKAHDLIAEYVVEHILQKSDERIK